MSYRSVSRTITKWEAPVVFGEGSTLFDLRVNADVLPYPKTKENELPVKWITTCQVFVFGDEKEAGCFVIEDSAIITFDVPSEKMHEEMIKIVEGLHKHAHDAFVIRVYESVLRGSPLPELELRAKDHLAEGLISIAKKLQIV